MKRIELIYDTDCPNVEATREQLRAVLQASGGDAEWIEWKRNDPNAPKYVRDYGSPTVLVDGVDVAGASPSSEVSCCRLYESANGTISGVPSHEAISAAIFERRHTSGRKGVVGADIQRGVRGMLPLMPAIGAAILPSLTCPACWPAYAGLLSAFGISFVNYTPYLLPIMAFFMVAAVASLAFRASRRRGYGPFILGLFSSAAVLVGKFAIESDPLQYAGLALLVGASIWNSWPKQAAAGDDCPQCITTPQISTETRS